MPAALPLLGDVRVPGDKSVTHRALLLGAFAEGITTIRGALRAADTEATAAIAAALGATVTSVPDGWRVTGTAAPRTTGSLDCANAGTAARLLLGLLAGRVGRWTLDGDESLRARPMGRVVHPLREAGASIEATRASDDLRLPLTVTGTPLRGRTHQVEVASAQVKSALLLAGLVADSPTTVIQHAPTRDHTERMLPAFGVRLEASPGTTTVHPGPLHAADVDVPGDPSSAAFLLVAAALVPGSDIRIRDVGLWPRRTGVLRALERAGAGVMVLARQLDAGADSRELGTTAMGQGGVPARGDPRGDLRMGHAELTAFDIAPEDVPDLVDELPILAVAAARARGTSRFAGLAELRHKESDRLATIATLLESLGGRVDVVDDGLVIEGVESFSVPADPPVFDDHRLALAQAVAHRSVGAPLPDLSSSSVSFPGFEKLLGALSG